MNLSFIFPVFNEGERLKLLFKKIILFNHKYLKNAQYIFVNDGSIDNSLELLKYFKTNNKKLNIQIYSYKKNRGKGYALKKGIEISNKMLSIKFLFFPSRQEERFNSLIDGGS